MLGAIGNIVGYATRPKATFFLKHPVRAIRILKFRNDVKEALSPQRIALGVGAAALAVPLGLWIGRKFTGA